MAVSAYLTISIFVSHSIYALRLAREGKLLTHHTDHSVLTLMSMDSIIERDYTSVRPIWRWANWCSPSVAIATTTCP